MKRKIICSVLALSMTLGGFAYADPDVSSLRQQLEENNRKKQEASSELQELQSQIDTATQDVLEAQSKLERLKSEIEVTKKELEKAEKNYQERNESLNSRVEAMYKSGNIGYVEVVLASESISDFFTRVDMVKSIVNHDNDVIKELKKEKETIDEKKSELEQKQTELKEAETEAKNKKNELVQLAESKESAVSELDSESQRLNSQIRTIEANNAAQSSSSRDDGSRTGSSSSSSSSNSSSSNNSSSSSNSSVSTPAPPPASGSASSVLSLAYKQLGIPYVWGGSTPSGFDCSGLTSYVYRNAAGVSLPRRARDQQNYGRSVSTSNLQPGDLVFWGRPATHVGIYVGNGNYLHSPRTGDVVKVSSLRYRPATSATRVL